MMTSREKAIKSLKYISNKHHNLSLLFHELAGSVKIKTKNMNSNKEVKAYLKSLNLDIDKMMKLSKSFEDISISDIKKDVEE